LLGTQKLIEENPSRPKCQETRFDHVATQTSHLAIEFPLDALIDWHSGGNCLLIGLDLVIKHLLSSMTGLGSFSV
jgi:hypothetical protein